MNPRRHEEAGYTLVESAIALTIFSMSLVGLYATLDVGIDHTEQAKISAIAEAGATRPLDELRELLTEGSPLHIDTCMRVRDLSSGFEISSDRFTVSGMRQCISPACRWHTSAGADPDLARLPFGHEHREGSFPSVTRGKVLPGGLAACPYDGSPTTPSGTLDAIRLFSARGPDGRFEVDESGRPRWRRLVVVAPFADARGLCELRAFEYDVTELLAGGPVSLGWSRWEPDNPTIVQLFDFGLDGTTNGEPDSRVPTGNAQSDATFEAFLWTTIEERPFILIRKQLGIPGLFPYRYLDLRIDLETGDTDFTATHLDALTSTWTVSTELRRAPRVLATNVTEFFCSTAVSHPEGAGEPDLGVGASQVVRLGLGVSREIIEEGKRRWIHDARTLDVAPMN